MFFSLSLESTEISKLSVSSFMSISTISVRFWFVESCLKFLTSSAVRTG